MALNRRNQMKLEVDPLKDTMEMEQQLSLNIKTETDVDECAVEQIFLVEIKKEFEENSSDWSHDNIKYEPDVNSTDVICENCGDVFQNSNKLLEHQQMSSYCNITIEGTKDLIIKERRGQLYLNQDNELSRKSFYNTTEGVKHSKTNAAEMENRDVKAEAMTDIILDNKNDTRMETEFISVEEVQYHAAPETLQQIPFDNYYLKDKEAGPSTAVYCVTCSTYCKDMETLTEHLKANIECQLFENGDQNVNTKNAIEHYTAKVNPFKSYVERNVCDICNKSFPNKGNLNQHKLIHTGKKPFSCDICNKSFTQKSSLGLHKQLHTGVKPYSCDICDKTFNRKGNLGLHKQRHTGIRPYSCDICKKTFSDKSNLNKHLLGHSGQKPFSCDVCSKAFTHKFSLDIHKNLHIGVKPYSCDVCSKAFTHKSSLGIHKKKNCIRE